MSNFRLQIVAIVVVFILLMRVSMCGGATAEPAKPVSELVTALDSFRQDAERDVAFNIESSSTSLVIAERAKDANTGRPILGGAIRLLPATQPIVSYLSGRAVRYGGETYIQIFTPQSSGSSENGNRRSIQLVVRNGNLIPLGQMGVGHVKPVQWPMIAENHSRFDPSFVAAEFLSVVPSNYSSAVKQPPVLSSESKDGLVWLVSQFDRSNVGNPSNNLGRFRNEIGFELREGKLVPVRARVYGKTGELLLERNWSWTAYSSARVTEKTGGKLQYVPSKMIETKFDEKAPGSTERMATVVNEVTIVPDSVVGTLNGNAAGEGLKSPNESLQAIVMQMKASVSGSAASRSGIDTQNEWLSSQKLSMIVFVVAVAGIVILLVVRAGVFRGSDHLRG